MSNLNEQFIFQAKEILKLITSTGQEAYIVGECLRDLVLDREIDVVEIFTSLGRENVINLFTPEQIVKVLDDSIFIHYLGLNFKISLSAHYPFSQKVKVKTPRRHYSTSLMDFLETKIYSVNTLAMANNNVIYDCFNGRQDIARKRIRMICDNTNVVFANDPIKMLEAIRLVSELGYRLDKNVYKGICKKKKGLLKTDLTLITKELIRIINGKYARKAIKLLIKSKLYKKIPLYKYEIKRLYNHFKKEEPLVFAAISLVKNKGYKEEVGFAFENPEQLKKIVELAIKYPKGAYDVTTLFDNKLDDLLKANIVNVLLLRAKNKQRQIAKLYSRLIIKNVNELAIKYQDIVGLNYPFTEGEIEELLRDLSNKVLHGKLKNQTKELMDYVSNEINKRKTNDEKIKFDDNTLVEDYQETLFEFNDAENIDIKETNLEELIDSNIEDQNVTNVTSDDKSKIDDMYQEYTEANLEFELLRRQQIELDRRVSELEIQNLEKELEEEIEKKIKQSGLLDGLVGSYRDSTHDTLRKVYYDVLIKTEKYQRLERNGDNNGQN